MKIHHSRRRALLALTCCLFATLMLASTAAHAVCFNGLGQPGFTVTNNSGCTIDVTFSDNNFPPTTLTTGPILNGGAVFIVTPTTWLGFFSYKNTTLGLPVIGFTAAGNPCNPPPPVWSVCANMGIVNPPPPKCCAWACWDAATCTVNFAPCVGC